MKNIHLFFATRNDLYVNIKKLEKELKLHYCLSGQFERKEQKPLSSLLNIKDLGTTQRSEVNLCENYIVLPKNIKVKYRCEFTLKRGLQYSYYQDKNPDSITVSFGGVYQNKYLLAGKVDTIGETKKSIALFKDFSTLLTQDFTKIKDYFVGSEAYKMLITGKRLITINIKTPPEYDLSLI